MRGLSAGPAVGRRLPALLAGTLGVLFLAAPAMAAETKEQTIERELPALAPPAGDGLGKALAAGRLSEAEYALERALAVAQPERARRLYGPVARPDPREGTVILRDLAARLPELGPHRRAVAERLLARPTDGRKDAIHGYRAKAKRVCGARMCFWWVPKTSDAPARFDRNRNGVPDWIDRTRAVFGDVWAKEVRRLGYRAPKPDTTSKNRGPNGKLDIYVADVGSKGLYGYCTTDDPARNRSRSVSAYCVVDNNFAPRQFGGSGVTGVRALKVTAAHEFFHAVQYGYDWLEDLWLMEGTAAWMEDEVYDAINDNRQYLKTSPLSPRFFWLPLDYHNPDPAKLDAGYKYGVWIFWRYLSERYGPGIVRDVWRRADGRKGAPNQYSLQATVSALKARGADFPAVLAEFGMANFFPAANYREGAFYPSPRATQIVDVGLDGIERTNVPMYHLSNDYYVFAPSSLPSGAALAITLDLPPAAASPVANALVESNEGTLVRVPAVQNADTGRWTIDVADFGASEHVLLVLTNASTRYACWRRSVFSCRGRPLDDVDFHFEAAVRLPQEPEEPPAPPDTP